MANYEEFLTVYEVAKDMNPHVGTVSPESFYESLRESWRNEPESPTTYGNLLNAKQEQRYYRLRKPSFRVTAGMAHALEHTNINIPQEELQSPFDVFQVQFEPGVLPLAKDSLIPDEIGAYRDAKRPYLGAMMVSLEDHIQYAGESKDKNFLRMLRCEISVGDLDDPTLLKQGCAARMTIVLVKDKTISEGIGQVQSYDYPGYQLTPDDLDRVSKILIGVMFLAVSKDRRWIQRTTIKLHSRDFCLCGSGKKYKRCCKLRHKADGQPVGFLVGKDIQLPKREQQEGTFYLVEGRGRELDYAHVRSGHMRWQWKNNEEGVRTRELIFIAPTVVRSDLPMKEQTTPRQVRSRG